MSKEGLTLTSKTTFKTEEEASKVADQYNRAGAKVIAMNRRKTVIQAPKLFSQNTLQGWMGKYYKMSPSDTLKQYNHCMKMDMPVIQEQSRNI